MKSEDQAARPAREHSFRQLLVEVALNEGEVELSLTSYDADAERQLVRDFGLSRQWALLSPCCPRSERAREEINLFYFNELRYEREENTGTWLKALIRDREGQWPDEPAFLLIDPQLRFVRDLAERCQQDMFFAARLGEGPRAIWL